eukprot:TRINITY_DN35261_c0_g1_i1.p1 TRINITY_DN35261_c0_g1~~TRINITY_DN35261_c0_g1_i1.p1  ORF type:complete len:600 (+),score=106.36 TRINITY_DN35261_c0_g1_i1:54-1853(+)
MAASGSRGQRPGGRRGGAFLLALASLGVLVLLGWRQTATNTEPATAQASGGSRRRSQSSSTALSPRRRAPAHPSPPTHTQKPEPTKTPAPAPSKSSSTALSPRRRAPSPAVKTAAGVAAGAASGAAVGAAASSGHRRRDLSPAPAPRLSDPAYGRSSGARPGSRTETSETGVGDEIRNAWWSAVFGWFMFLAGFPLLWANEMRIVTMQQMFTRGRKLVKRDLSSSKVDGQYDSCLVHVQGETSTKQVLKDSIFGLEVVNCAKLHRGVEMYQWVEHTHTESKDKPGGGKETTTTYTYSREWSSTHHNANSFRNREDDMYNPKFAIDADSHDAAVDLGAFKVPNVLVGQMANWKNCTADCKIQQPGKVASLVDGALNGQYIQSGASRGFSPEIGDIRVSFKKLMCGPATVLAVQTGTTFVPFKATMKDVNGKIVDADDQEEDFQNMVPHSLCGLCCCLCKCMNFVAHMHEEIFALYERHVSANDAIKKLEMLEGFWEMFRKLAGYALIILGLYNMFSMGPTLFRVIPYAGVWVESFGKWIVWILAIILGTILGAMTTTIAWLAARPLKAALILTGLGLLLASPFLWQRYDEGLFPFAGEAS